MRNFGLVVWAAMAVTCGRIDFDPLAGSGNRGDDATIDTRMNDATGDGPQALSCAGLAAICGPAGTSPCCGNQLVPGSTFDRSYDVGTDNAYTDMTKPATVNDFRLDIYEVTVGRFRQFINAGMGTQANPPATGAGARTLNAMASQGGWSATWNGSLATNSAALTTALKCDGTYQSWTTSAGANEALPINCLTWFEAFAFCAWDDGFLPTEAEWNYASAGGTEQRAYPWSNPPSSLTVDCAHANYNTCQNSPTGAVNRVGSESPLGDGAWGQADLAGNVWELMLDWYASPYGVPCLNCADLTAATDRVIRGGDYFGAASDLRGAFRSTEAPATRSGSVGVRCARAP